MKRYAVLVGGAAVLALVLGGATFASEVEEKSPAQKLRKDMGKQVTKYTQCLTKAATKCEQGGATSATECHLDTGVVDYAGDPDLDPKNKQPAAFQEAIAKCDGKINLAKKGTGNSLADYEAIGCPGDCTDTTQGDDPGGTQRCADLAAYETNLIGTSPDSAKAILPVLAAAIDAACGVDTGAAPTDQVRKDCGADNAAALSKWSKGVFKCQEKCENDYKDKKGGGGDDDGPSCLIGAVGSSTAVNDCADAALLKAGTLSLTVEAVVFPLVRDAINDATDGLYNKDDPTTAEGAAGDDDVCSECGNNVREGTEECDGTDDGVCPTACTTACKCPPVCGNNVQQGAEECDGTDDLACPGLCAACNCP